MSLFIEAAYFALDRGGVEYLIVARLLFYSLTSTRVSVVDPINAVPQISYHYCYHGTFLMFSLP